jgi:hypothetical protein
MRRINKVTKEMGPFGRLMRLDKSPSKCLKKIWKKMATFIFSRPKIFGFFHGLKIGREIICVGKNYSRIWLSTPYLCWEELFKNMAVHEKWGVRKADIHT